MIKQNAMFDQFFAYTDITKHDFSYDDIKEEKVILFGMGNTALREFAALRANDIAIIGFSDTRGGNVDTFCGLPVYSINELQGMENPVIFIAVTNIHFRIQIMDYITRNVPAAKVLCRGRIISGMLRYDVHEMEKCIHLNQEKIEYVKKHLSDECSKKVFCNMLELRRTNDFRFSANVMSKKSPYFDDDIFSFSKHEVFVDAGGYNANTSVQFDRVCSGKYDKIYILEPDRTMCTVAREMVKLKHLHDVVVLEKGLWSDSAEKVSFISDISTASSRIREKGSLTVKTVSIDEMFDKERVTFIKMDIEGAERQALSGSSQTIQRCHPKLAICLYHIPDDLWEIPYSLMTSYPDYRFYVRHYSSGRYDTILYADI